LRLLINDDIELDLCEPCAKIVEEARDNGTAWAAKNPGPCTQDTWRKGVVASAVMRALRKCCEPCRIAASTPPATRMVQ